MKRAPIIILVVVTAIAAAGIAVVLCTRQDGAPDAAGGQPVVSTGAAKQLTDAETAAKATGPAADKAGGDLGTGGNVRTPLASPHSRLAAEMTPRQRQAVIRSRWLRMRKEVKYRLPSTYKLLRLGRAADADLRLTDHQKEQITLITEAMKPKIEEALKDVWARRQKVQQDMQAAVADRNDQEIQANRSRYTQLVGQGNRIRQDVLDKQFQDMLREVLTAEQMEILTSDLSSPEHIRKLYGRRQATQATSESVQYQNIRE
ncbi:MAG: hypothetical protein GWP05_03760 [Anaerolineaceae bacterium]|nr:hypothetical protein [Anaerolineaceae bacterium]